MGEFRRARDCNSMAMNLRAIVIFSIATRGDALSIGHGLHPCRASVCRMMFGGGGDGKDEAGFMDQLKAAKDMFNPEMMKKYSEVGVKVQALQEELTQTEVECATNEGGIIVKVTGTQVPISVEVTDEICAGGAESLSNELAAALKQAHAKSGAYAQKRMADLYEEMGLAGGLAGMGK